MVKYSVRSHRGCIREKNEDRYFVPPEDGPFIFAVADGMGGHAGGEVASSLSIKILGEKVLSKVEQIQQYDLLQMRDYLEQVIQKANEKIVLLQEKKPELQGMGTTLTVVVLFKKEILVGHVGDSQVHLFNRERHFQVTEDHSLVMELFKKGEIAPEQVHTHPQRHLLIRALGTADLLEVDFYINDLEDEKYILLCTDGLTSMLKPIEIKEIIFKNNDLEAAADELLNKANEVGGLDNITFILFQLQG
jgi:serine/threonine protein phosphatase PrpC